MGARVLWEVVGSVVVVRRRNEALGAQYIRYGDVQVSEVVLCPGCVVFHCWCLV